MTEELEGTSTSLAIQETSTGAISSYLANLKPILETPTDAAGVWTRALAELRSMSDQRGAHGQAVQLALGLEHQFSEARRQLAQTRVPPGCQDVHLAVDAWLRSMVDSFEVVIRSSAPMASKTFVDARRALQEATQEADNFNAQRETLVTALEDRQNAPKRRPGMVASKKEMRAMIIGLVAAFALTAGSAYAMNSLIAAQETPAPVEKPVPAARIPTDRVRIFERPEIEERLRREVQTRFVQFHNTQLRLVPPDKVVVPGAVEGTNGLVPVEVELVLSVNGAGQPIITPGRITAVGVQVPEWAVEALRIRSQEANRELANQLQPGERVRAITVEANRILVDLDTGPAAPAPAAPPAAKPGG